MSTSYTDTAPTRDEVDLLEGATLIEFGANGCGYCRGAQPLISTALAAYPTLRHFRVEDGPGRAPGRSFKVKLWPTLVFLRDGQEVARLVRPTDTSAIGDALALQANGSHGP